MHRLRLWTMVLLAGMSVSGCASDIAKTRADAPPPRQISYTVGPDDKLHINVYNEPQLTGDYIVNNQGDISFPLAGSLPVSGLTVDQVAAKITDALRGTFFKDAHVAVDPLVYRPVFVLGEVNKAGQFPYQSGMTVLAAVASAGGFTYRANQKIVMVRHPGATSEERERLTADLMVSPGDTIRIKERYF